MIRLFLIFFFVFFLTACTSLQENPLWQSGTQDNDEKYATGLTDDEKVSLTLQRKKELRTIRKGDYMTLKNNPEKAILYYQEALEKLPDDVIIRRKIAHTYYLLRNWKNAYDEYSKVPLAEIKDEEQKELFQSLFFDETRLDRLGEVSKYHIDPIAYEYYSIVDTCYSGVHNCIVSIESYTWQSTKILDLKQSIKNSTQISPDFQYRNFLVAAQFYEYGMYRVTDVLTNEILLQRPNYNEVKKLRGFALFELGKYTLSRDILLSYLEQNTKDLESIVKLWEIYAALGDFVSSSLYLNNAIAGGYPNKAPAERRLAYNYSMLGDTASMLKVLGYLVQESDVSEDDYAVAISLALYQWENTKAYIWAYSAIEKYKNSEIIIPLYLSALRMNLKFHDTVEFVKNLDEDTAWNPLIQLEYAIALYEMKLYKEAAPIFESIVDNNPQTDWANEADNYLGLTEAMLHSENSLKK